MEATQVIQSASLRMRLVALVGECVAQMRLIESSCMSGGCIRLVMMQRHIAEIPYIPVM